MMTTLLAAHQPVRGIGATYRIYLPFILLSVSLAYHVFMIGDSVDRFTVMDWCDKRGDGPNCGGYRCTFWSENGGISASDPAYRPSMRCDMGNDTLTYLHNYGSRAFGPYLRWIDERRDPFARTPMRIRRGLDLYFERLGVPDLVMLHTAQWDIQQLYNEQGTRKAPSHGDYDVPFSALWNSSLQRFENDMNDRVTDLQENLARNLLARNLSLDRTNIGLRTAAWDAEGGIHLHGMNDIIRDIAWRRNVTLYDLDSDVWGTVDWDYDMQPKLLRDWIHPNPTYTAMAGEKISGAVYTSNLFLRGNGSETLFSKTPQVWLGEGTKPERRKLVQLVREDVPHNNAATAAAAATSTSSNYNGASAFIHSALNRSMAYRFLYPSTMHKVGTGNPSSHIYYIYENSAGHLVRSGPINTLTRLLLRLAPSDILSIAREQLERIRKTSPPPKALLEATSTTTTTAVLAPVKTAINTTAGKLYLLEQGQLRLAPGVDALQLHGVSVTNITQGIDDFWMNLLPRGAPIPDIYRDDQLFRLSASREVFVYKDGSAHSVASAGVFFAHGWSFDNVIVLNDVVDFNVIPRGEPMVS